MQEETVDWMKSNNMKLIEIIYLISDGFDGANIH